MPKHQKKPRKLTDIVGLNETDASKLKKCGIQIVEDLVNKTGTPKARAAISEATGISKRTISEWAIRAELLMIDGIGPEYARLLEKAGVDSAPELALQDPKKLHKKMVEANKRHVVNRVPSEREVNRWIRQALRSPGRRS